MSYFSTLPAGDHGNAMPGHWYSHSSAAPAVRLIIIINVGNGSPVLSLTPATRLCRFHFIIVITLCHNLLCLLLPPLPLPSSSSPLPRLPSAHDTSSEGIIIMQFQCQKRSQFPWPGTAAIFLLFSVICAANCFHGSRQVFNYWQIERHRQLKAIN